MLHGSEHSAADALDAQTVHDGETTSGSSTVTAKTSSQLGIEVRRRREERGLSLRALAKAAGFSPSFVSRLERGLAEPRLNSLHRIARALDTSAQGLLSGTSAGGTYSLVRASDRTLPIRERRPPGRAGSARSLVEGKRTLTALEFTEYTTDFGPPYEHPGEELMIVAAGSLEVELGGDTIVLEPGDTLCYPGSIPHRSRALPGESPVVYLITTRPEGA